MLETVHRPLEISGTIPLSAFELSRLHAIEKYDLWFVIERVQSEGTIAPHLICSAVTEFKKYMALISLGHTNLGMLSQEVDEIWHNFILFTREYGEFCETTCGQMVHHRPNTSRRPHLSPASISNFTEAYTTFFGPIPTIWQNSGTQNNHYSANACEATGEDRCDAPEVGDGCDGPGDGDDAGNECDGVSYMRSRAGECDVDGTEPDSSVVMGDCDSAGGPALALR